MTPAAYVLKDRLLLLGQLPKLDHPLYLAHRGAELRDPEAQALAAEVHAEIGQALSRFPVSVDEILAGLLEARAGATLRTLARLDVEYALLWHIEALDNLPGGLEGFRATLPRLRPDRALVRTVLVAPTDEPTPAQSAGQLYRDILSLGDLRWLGTYRNNVHFAEVSGRQLLDHGLVSVLQAERPNREPPPGWSRPRRYAPALRLPAPGRWRGGDPGRSRKQPAPRKTVNPPAAQEGLFGLLHGGTP